MNILETKMTPMEATINLFHIYGYIIYFTSFSYISRSNWLTLIEFISSMYWALKSSSHAAKLLENVL